MIRQKSKVLKHGAARYLGHAAALALMAFALSGCGGGSMFGASSSGSQSSLGSRFSQLFGSKSQAVGEAQPQDPSGDAQLTCPPVSIRSGASTLAIGLPGKPASGEDLRYQVTITRTARDCNLEAGQITARVGIEGRVIVGPAGAPPSVDIPLRIAVVQEGVSDKIIFTKAYRTTVAMPEGTDNNVYSFVAEDVIYAAPKPEVGDSYVFYIGFDPNGLKPQPAARPARRGKPKAKAEQG